MITDTALVQRIQALREELGRGSRQLELVEQQRQEIRDTMLRISGAIQILEEVLAPRHDGQTESPTGDTVASLAEASS